MLHYGRQSISREDIKSVVQVLKSDFLASGPKIKEFEDKFSQYVGSKYSVAVSNGTAALHLACLASGLKKGDELITSPMTFCASANCALYCQAKPVFVDINDQGLINENEIERKINKNTRIIIPVHYSGLPCNLTKIKKIAQKHSLVIIEDACHALGARYKKTKIGDCQFSDMAVFSFHPVKHITTGEGGMITTNSKKLYQRLLLLRNHGIIKKPFQNKPWHQEMRFLGFNYRLTDIQAALGISQLRKVKRFVKKRRRIAQLYDKAFKNCKNVEVIKENKDQRSSYHLYPIRTKDAKTRLRLFNYLKRNDIYCQVHYIPVYWHPYYQKLGCKKGLCLKSEDFYKREISIPLYPSMQVKDINYITGQILNFLKVFK
jgi:UDP-4-amino-4,6-dideoxy-N-acetyl-beta-L-altrosamine transaminase